MKKQPFKLDAGQKLAAKKWLNLTEWAATSNCPIIYDRSWDCRICQGLFPSLIHDKRKCPCNVLTYKHVRKVVLKAVK